MAHQLIKDYRELPYNRQMLKQPEVIAGLAATLQDVHTESMKMALELEVVRP